MDPIFTILHAGSIERPIANYGVCLAMSLLLGAGLAARAGHRARLDTGRLIGVLGFAALGGLAGAWALAVAVESVRTGDVVNAVRHGGLVFYGALLGAGGTFFIAARMLGVPALRAADLAVPGIAVAHAIGRIGCFLAGCCFGSRFDGAWAIVYRDEAAPASIEAIARHPTPLYEAALLLGLALVFTLRPPTAARPGFRFGAYVACYGIMRFALEFVRGDAVRGFVGPFSTSQVLALATTLAAVTLLTRNRLRVAAYAGVLLAVCVFPPAPGWGQARDGLQPALRLRVANEGPLRIPGGWFERGSYDEEILEARSLCMRHALNVQAFLCDDSRFEAERPRQQVWISSFGIDRTEVPRGAYERCVEAMACSAVQAPSDAQEDPTLPVVGVSHRDADAFCRFVGGRLPTEAEWERAARGTSGRMFPWGRYFNERIANHGTVEARPDDTDGYETASPVASFPDGASVYGVLDLAGNVWEWTADGYDLYGNVTVRVDPRVIARGQPMVIRGGSWLSPPFALRSAYREALAPDVRRPDVGFRCAYD